MNGTREERLKVNWEGALYIKMGQKGCEEDRQPCPDIAGVGWSAETMRRLEMVGRGHRLCKGVQSSLKEAAARESMGRPYKEWGLAGVVFKGFQSAWPAGRWVASWVWQILSFPQAVASLLEKGLNHCSPWMPLFLHCIAFMNIGFDLPLSSHHLKLYTLTVWLPPSLLCSPNLSLSILLSCLCFSFKLWLQYNISD